MNKKIVVGFAVVLFSIFALANSAFAVFDEIFMTDAYGKNNRATDEVEIFGWNVQPWLYLDLPSTALTYTISWWNPVGTETFYSDYDITEGTDEVWHTLDDWLDEGGPRQLGDWEVRADYSYSGGTYSDTTNFTVTPEPVSSALFLIGGVSLAAFGYRRRRRKIV